MQHYPILSSGYCFNGSDKAQSRWPWLLVRSKALDERGCLLTRLFPARLCFINCLAFVTRHKGTKHTQYCIIGRLRFIPFNQDRR